MELKTIVKTIVMKRNVKVNSFMESANYCLYLNIYLMMILLIWWFILIFLNTGIETIEQEISLGNGRARPIQIHTRNFENAGDFEDKKADFIKAIALTYGHAENLINAQLKDGETNVIIVTFTIADTSQKDSILEVTGNESTLKASLNYELQKIEGFETLTVTEVSEAKSFEITGTMIVQMSYLGFLFFNIFS